MDNKKYIYIVLSGTNTKFAKCIRRFGHTRYNHVSVGLDKSFSKIYSFARPEHNAIFCGKLVKETMERFTLRKNEPVPIRVFEVPVSVEDYENIVELIKTIYNDKEYIYNLFSVLSYPITKGFATYKAYTCVEFSAMIIEHLGFKLDKPIYRYKPDELIEILSEYEIYRGDIRGYVRENDIKSDDIERDDAYFKPMTLKMIKNNALNFFLIVKRSVFW
jgi:hypothetical protein